MSHYVPKDLDDNLAFRASFRGMIEPEEAARWRQMCRDDIFFYVNAFCWTYRPKVKAGEHRVVPFICRPRQEECLRLLVDHISSQEPLVIEKSRDEGASWMLCYVFEWLWHWHDWTQTLLVSRVGALVDSKSPDSLFWKFDFIHKFLPPWMMPKWDPRKDRIQMFAGNPETNSTVTGQPTTQDIGIAGRATAIGFDEYSRVPNAYEVLDGTKDTADCRIWVSTHWGPGTAFADLCGYGDRKPGESLPDKFVLHWTHNPEKNRGMYRSLPNGTYQRLDPANPPDDYPFVTNGLPSGGYAPGIRSPWYDKQCRERSQRDVALNIDIDVAGASKQFFERLQIIRLKDEFATDFPPVWVGEVEYDRDSGRPVQLVANAKGRLKLWTRPDGYGRIRPSPKGFGMGVDNAEGTGASRSCLSGFDASTGEMVLEYANPFIKPYEMAPMVSALGWLFQDESGQPAKIAWEVPGPGHRMGQCMIQCGYGNFYYRRNELQVVDQSPSTTPGWHSNKETKRLLLEQYRDALYTKQCINRSADALEECLNFKYMKDGSVDHAEIDNESDESGARINHGDMVIANALAWKMAKLLSPQTPLKVELADDPPENSFAWRRKLRQRAPTAWFQEIA